MEHWYKLYWWEKSDDNAYSMIYYGSMMVIMVIDIIYWPAHQVLEEISFGIWQKCPRNSPVARTLWDKGVRLRLRWLRWLHLGATEEPRPATTSSKIIPFAGFADATLTIKYNWILEGTPVAVTDRTQLISKPFWRCKYFTSVRYYHFYYLLYKIQISLIWVYAVSTNMHM